MSKIYLHLQNKFFNKYPRILKIYRLYLETNDNTSVSGKIRAYAFLLRQVITKGKTRDCDKYNPDNLYFECKHLGDYNKDKVIYYIHRDETAEGFVAIIRTILYATAFADNFNMVPVITISD